jgi:Xaa-Pro aminopeptidase
VVEHGFKTIITSIKMAFQALKPGVKGIDIDQIARDYIVSQGYKEYPHALGHQVGRTAHDGSALLAPAWERYGNLPYLPLEEGQVFTIEPRLYLEEQGVVTVEEMVVITRTGAEFLSSPQEEIYLIR